MEEEKGGVIHVIFIIFGVALLSLGVFELLTDEHIELEGEQYSYQNTEKGKDDNTNNNQDVIKQISLMNNIETSITLKNGKEVKIQYYLSSETNTGKFNYNEKTVFNTNEHETCDSFYLYNDSIVAYCAIGSTDYGDVYVIDSTGLSSKTEKITSKEYDILPQSLLLKDDKLIVSGRKKFESNVSSESDLKELLCNNDELTNQNISQDSPVTADFELKVTDDKVDFSLNKVTKTVKEFIDENCKSVE